MHFVAALDRVPGMRCVLGLFEGVVTGAADGYARMAGKPAATLLHCGPGLANGLANLHNARRAADAASSTSSATRRPTTGRYDAPLTADTEGWARGVSAWVRTAIAAATVGADAAVAVQAARTHPGQIATLILPSDTSWDEGGVVADACRAAQPAVRPAPRSATPREILRRGVPTLIVLGGEAVRAEALAQRIASPPPPARSLIAQGSPTPASRAGRGRLPVERVPYVVDVAVKALAGTQHLILVRSRKPRDASSPIRTSRPRRSRRTPTSTCWLVRTRIR